MRLLAAALLLLSSCAAWTWHGKELALEICDSPSERARGLRGHPPLEGNQGLLFVYPEPKKCSYWMKDVPYPIDLAFIDAKGVVLEIVDMKALDETPVSSPSAVRFVLEMRQGWFREQGLEKGAVWKELAAMDWTHAQ
ncbi:MAG: DUF192 domain-containing protein [Planctomycetota bacterium]